MQGSKPSMHDHHSFNPLIGDSAATTVEGLRKLALTYRSTMQGQLNLEKFRNTSQTRSNIPKRFFDPRFRRTRDFQTFERITAKSDTKVPTPYNSAKRSLLNSLPTVSSMPSSPKHSPRTKFKSTKTRARSNATRSPDTLDPGVEDMFSLNKVKQIPEIDVTATIKSKPGLRRMNSFVDRIQKCSVKNMDIKKVADKQTSSSVDVGTVSEMVSKTEAMVGSATKMKTCGEQATETNDESIEPTKEPFHSVKSSGDGKGILQTYVHPPVEIVPKPDETMVKSITTMAMSNDPSMHHCVCVRCAKVYSNKDRQCDYESSAGTKTIIAALEKLEYARFRQQDLQDCIWMWWCLFILGCICGLVLVSSIVWLLTNGMDLNWIYPKAPPKKPPIFVLVSNFSAGFFFLVNIVNTYILSTIYKIMTMPRSSVFGTSNEQDSTSSWYWR